MSSNTDFSVTLPYVNFFIGKISLDNVFQERERLNHNIVGEKNNVSTACEFRYSFHCLITYRMVALHCFIIQFNCLLPLQGGTLEAPAYIGNVGCPPEGKYTEKNLDFRELGPQRINEILAKD